MPAAISAVKTVSAVQVASAFFARSSFQYPFKGHPDSGLAQTHDPAGYPDIFIISKVGNNQFKRLAK